jgi:hypothetical protein
VGEAGFGAGVNIEREWFVLYEVMGERYAAGPYRDQCEAERQREDIAGYEGVSRSYSSTRVPPEYKRLDAKLSGWNCGCGHKLTGDGPDTDGGKFSCIVTGCDCKQCVGA